jgi:hypothetical protein
VDQYFPKEAMRTPRLLRDTKTYSYRCPFTTFDFLVLEKDSSNDRYFYGQFDVYKLKFDNNLPVDRILKIENDGVEILLNKLNLANANMTESERYAVVRENILNLYYFRLDEYHDLYFPTFRYATSSIKSITDFKTDENRKIIEEELSVYPEHLLILRDEHLGLLIFKIEISDEQRISVTEFLIKSSNQLKHFKPDNSSDFIQCRL